jgi:hypothetical protein
MVLPRVVFRGLQISIHFLCCLACNNASTINVFLNASHHLHLDETIIILGYFSVDMIQNSDIRNHWTTICAITMSVVFFLR